MRLYCRKCKIALTNELKALGIDAVLDETDGQPHIPSGYYAVSDGNYFTNTEGNILVNCGDLINCDDHPDTSRLQGCCGPSGSDGLNKVCLNGHEIGTECSDCWMAHAVIFEIDAVDVVSEK